MRIRLRDFLTLVVRLKNLAITKRQPESPGNRLRREFSRRFDFAVEMKHIIGDSSHLDHALRAVVTPKRNTGILLQGWLDGVGWNILSVATYYGTSVDRHSVSNGHRRIVPSDLKFFWREMNAWHKAYLNETGTKTNHELAC